jgi:ABC-type antimicrobial peptide transport system permease subunit
VLLRRVEAERRSIGIRRALGLPRGGIVAGLVARAGAIAAAGVVLGVAAGYLAVELLRAFGSGQVPAIAALAEALR